MSQPADDSNKPAEKPGPLENATTTPSAENLGHQVVGSLRALNTLIQLALAESTARFEARQQLNRLATNLAGLANQSRVALEHSQESALIAAWQLLQHDLAELVQPATEPDPELEPEITAVSLSEEEISRRLGLSLPPHLTQPGSSQAPPSADKTNRRVLIASLESNSEVTPMISQATASFPRDKWSITNLGANVPIMALTGMIMDTRPAVIVLVLAKAELLGETTRLVTDLKRQLFGLKLILVGPILSQPGLADRLRADLYSITPNRAAELAEQFFNPLTKLGSPLRLAVELPADETSADIPADETATVPSHQPPNETETETNSPSSEESEPLG